MNKYTHKSYPFIVKKSLKFFLLGIMILVLNSKVFSQNPGGVAGTTAWVKADAGVTQTSGTVTTWANQANVSNNYTNTGSPTLTTGAINFNPAITFLGTGVYFTSVSAVNTGLYTKFAVYKSTGTAVLLANTSGFGDNFYKGGSTDMANQHNNGTQISATPGNTAKDNVYYVASSNYSGVSNTSTLNLNGTQKNASSNVSTYTSAPSQIGTNVNNVASINANIAEAIVYNSSLSTTNVQRVESYLGVKYGITMERNYLSSSSATTYDVSDAFSNNIAGIGRDDNTALNQKQSQSINTGSDDNMIIMGLSTIATTNQLNASTFANNNSYDIWGDNGATPDYVTSLSGVPGYSQRMLRRWKLTETGTVGMVRVAIPTAKLAAGRATAFLVSASATFTTGINTIYYPAGTQTINGVPCTYFEVDFPSSATNYFTLIRANTTTYYPIAGTADMSVLANWTTNVDGIAATAPSNFTSGSFIINNTNATQTVANNWTISGTATVTLTNYSTSNNMVIAAGAYLTVSTGASFDFNGKNVVVRSNATATGAIGNTTGTITNATNVTVERFINTSTYGRRWHLLSPTVATQSVYNSWQEAGADNATYGTFITNPAVNSSNSTNDATSGFDRVSTNIQPLGTTSIRGVTNAGALTTIANTKTTLLSSQPAWFLFVRSARPAGSYNNSLTGDATLRTNGTLIQGSQTAITVATGSGLVTVGNPYASPVTITGSFIPQTNGTSRRFYAWDPGYGAAQGGYKLYTNNVTPAAAAAFPVTMNQLQSGQAILIPQGGTAGSVTFTEASKAATVYGNVLRNSNTSAVPNGIIIRLKVADEANNLQERDLTYAEFSAAMSNGYVPGEDVEKLSNFTENISLLRNNKYVYVEGMQQPTANDSLHVQLWKTTASAYTFEIETSGLTNGMIPYLVDTRSGTITPLNENGVSTYSFTSNGGNTDLARFEIIFKNAAALPVTVTGIKATKQGSAVNVEWNVTNESGISNYEIEQSTDAVVFSKFGAVAATNNATAHSYNAVHQTPNNGVNYYRVKSTGLNGAVKYTNVVKVIFGKDDNATVSVYPNPVKGGIVNVSLNNLSKGSYTLTVYSTEGRNIASKNIVIADNSTINETMQLPAGTAKGVYQLQVINATKAASFTQKIIIE